MIQWGRRATLAKDTEYVTMFEKPFPNSCFQVHVTTINKAPSGEEPAVLGVRSVTRTNFRLVNDHYGGTNDGAYFYAIGN